MGSRKTSGKGKGGGMQVFEKLAEYRYEQLVFCHDKATGLQAIIAIHDTTLGPALGGRYIVAEDVGTSTEDMENIRIETSHVVGVDVTHGGSGDPSPFTALGVMQGMKACAEEVFGSPSLEGRTVAVQGLGHVGYHLCGLLHGERANLIVCDINQKAVERALGEFGAKQVGADEILSIPCDILAPCALGAVVNDISLPNLRCSIIAGSANNVLLEPRHGEALAERGLLYAPDYVINAGGLINVADELEGYNEKRATKRVMRIYDSMKSILAIAKRDGVPTHVAADTLALERIDAISSIERLHTGHPYGLERRRRETL